MKRLFVLIAIVFVLLVGFSLWWNNGMQAVNATDKKQQIFVVQKGQGVREIANQLKNQGLIKDPIVFFLLTKKLGIDSKIEAGDFRLSPSMNAEQIAQTLTHGTLDVWVTIPEGKRATEIAAILKHDLPSYKPSWDKTLEENEGYLFPDTYLVPRAADITEVVSLLRNTFDKKYQALQKDATTSLSENDVVTLASIVEREARFPEDRPLVASVYMNRIRLNMPLQADATVQYALGYQASKQTWWKKDITEADLQVASPYNTYTNIGLPPTPIANPGALALEAALHPAQTDYLYYISDASGHIHYAKTLAEHNANIKKYGL